MTDSKLTEQLLAEIATLKERIGKIESVMLHLYQENQAMKQGHAADMVATQSRIDDIFNINEATARDLRTKMQPLLDAALPNLDAAQAEIHSIIGTPAPWANERQHSRAPLPEDWRPRPKS